MQPLGDLLLALAIGLLIGLERGWEQREAPEGSRIAGLRTYALVGLLGGVWALLGRDFGDLVLGASLLVLGALLIVARWQDMRRDKDVGITSAVALLLAFALGATAVRGFRLEAASLAVLATVLLSLKPLLHGWLRRISGAELNAFLKLLLMGVVLLPVLPNRGMGPWQALNPFEIGWMVLLIATISFIAWFAMKLAGVRRGVLYTALFGGLVSSTAVTINFSRMAQAPAARRLAGAGILLACGTMFPRMLVLVLLVQPALAATLTLPLLVMAAVLMVVALWDWRHRDDYAVLDGLPIDRPLDLSLAFKFGLFLVAVMLLLEALRRFMGETGVYLLGVASGVMDVDAITLSLARSTGPDLAARVAAWGILLAAMTNTLVKAGLALAIGGRGLGLRVGGTMVAAVAAGAALAALV